MQAAQKKVVTVCGWPTPVKLQLTAAMAPKRYVVGRCVVC